MRIVTAFMQGRSVPGLDITSFSATLGSAREPPMRTSHGLRLKERRPRPECEAGDSASRTRRKP